MKYSLDLQTQMCGNKQCREPIRTETELVNVFNKARGKSRVRLYLIGSLPKCLL